MLDWHWVCKAITGMFLIPPSLWGFTFQDFILRQNSEPCRIHVDSRLMLSVFFWLGLSLEEEIGVELGRSVAFDLEQEIKIELSGAITALDSVQGLWLRYKLNRLTWAFAYHITVNGRSLRDAAGRATARVAIRQMGAICFMLGVHVMIKGSSIAVFCGFHIIAEGLGIFGFRRATLLGTDLHVKNGNV